jgi:rubrerythrin
MIRFRCPACDKILRSKDEGAGKKARCPSCKAIATIPITPSTWAGDTASQHDVELIPADEFQVPSNPSPQNSLSSGDYFFCPKCKTAVPFGESKSGDKFPCPLCGQRLQAPARPPNPMDKTLLGMLSPIESPALNPIESAEEQAAAQAAWEAEAEELAARLESPDSDPSIQVKSNALPQRSEPSGAFPCPHCAQPIEDDPSIAGQEVRCPHCERTLQMPGEPVKHLAPSVPVCPPVPRIRRSNAASQYNPSSREISCPRCDGLVIIETDPRLAGQEVQCPYCGGTIPGVNARIRRASWLLFTVRIRQAARKVFDLTQFGGGPAERLGSALVLGAAFFFVTLLIAYFGRLQFAFVLSFAAVALITLMATSGVLVLWKSDTDLEEQALMLPKLLSALREETAEAQAAEARAWEKEAEELAARLVKEGQKAAAQEAKEARRAAAREAEEARRAEEEAKRCPYCRESILLGAAKCKHCGESQTPAQSGKGGMIGTGPLIRCYQCGAMEPASEVSRRKVKIGETYFGFGGASHYGMVDLCRSCTESHDRWEAVKIGLVLALLLIGGVVAAILYFSLIGAPGRFHG